MTDAKRTGSRDISELKQRLGLKKGGAASQSGSVPAVRSNGTSGGVVPPPGLNLPPPPGVTPATPMAPPQPVIPNAADDPFGAMNAMAAVATVQRAPEMVIVHDGKPVENVGAAGGGTKLALIIAPAAVALIIGLFMGRSSRGGSDVNDGISAAGAVYENVHSLKTGALNEMTKIDGMPAATGQGKKPQAHTAITPNSKLDKSLGGLVGKLDVKAEQYALVRNITLDSDTAGKTLEFYAGLAELKEMINIHVAAAVSDDQAYKAAATAVDDAKVKPDIQGTLIGPIRYAVVLSGPSDKEPNAPIGARFVELGPPYCNNTLATGGKCPDGENPSGFGYRTENGGAWKPANAVEGMNVVPVDKIVPFVDSNTLDSFLQGNTPSAAVNAYGLRVQAIADKVQDLIDRANKLEPQLETAKSQSTKFTFFM